MRAYKSCETLDITIQNSKEIDALRCGESLRVAMRDCPIDCLVLRCRDEVGQDLDQQTFDWYEPERTTQHLTEPGFWVERFPWSEDGKEYRKVIVTISKENLDKLASGKVEDNCLLTRCCFDRLQIRYYPGIN